MGFDGFEDYEDYEDYQAARIKRSTAGEPEYSGDIIPTGTTAIRLRRLRKRLRLLVLLLYICSNCQYPFCFARVNLK